MVLFERMLSTVWLIGMLVIGANLNLLLSVECRPHRILLDTDLDTDDVFALFYLLKLDRSLFRLEGVTINTNGWSNAGHAVNQVYDILYMMGRDDVLVGVGGEGGILDDGTILPDVGGYLSIIDQENTTFGGCRYRQAIPIGPGGRLDIDTAYGIRRSFLPQGLRKYSPLQQATAQQVLVEKISEGPISVFIIGAHTNMALFLMNHPHLKRNIEHIYAMGGGVRSKNPRGCSARSSNRSFAPAQCGDPGNLFIDTINNPYAEFNIFADPFAAHQVIHSGIPITLVPLDATDTIPVTEDFFKAFERVQDMTQEAKYCYNLLKMSHDTWFDDQFYTSYFMWDSFMAGVAVSMMSTNSHEENEFAEMEYMNITVVTSNEPYGVSDGSNPFFDRHYVPKFNLNENGVHSGHVQTGIQDPFCKTRIGKGKCQDGYTKEVMGEEGARVLVATRAKPNRDASSPLNREFFTSFLDVLSRPENSGRFNFTTQCFEYREVFYKPDFGGKRLGKPVVFDMDMSAGDFLALFYLLKVPVEVIDLKAIIVSPSGWANGATIDVVYDVLHMMGRDDIPVGLGDVYAINQHDPSLPSAGDCKYAKAIPHGSGGFLDSDTLYGLARDLPRSPRRYTAEKSVEHGARKDTDHPELRQPMAMEIWDSVFKTLDPESKITVLTNGPLTNLAKMILSHENDTSRIKEVYVVGGHIRSSDGNEKGNVFAIDSNNYAEYNMFLDPHAAKTVFESTLNITLAPLNVQRKIASFPTMLARLRLAGNIPEAAFSKRLISRLHRLKKKHHRYHHTDMFLGEILGVVVLAGDGMDPTYQIKPVRVVAKGDESEDGEIVIDEKGKSVKILTDVDVKAFYELYAQRMSDEKQSAVIGSFDDQQRAWGECSENRSYRRRLRKRF